MLILEAASLSFLSGMLLANLLNSLGVVLFFKHSTDAARSRHAWSTAPVTAVRLTIALCAALAIISLNPNAAMIIAYAFAGLVFGDFIAITERSSPDSGETNQKGARRHRESEPGA